MREDTMFVYKESIMFAIITERVNFVVRFVHVKKVKKYLKNLKYNVEGGNQN